MIAHYVRHPRTRAGITLVEILISLLIMSVGIVSIAALFPVGLERLRAAQRNTRSAYLKRAALSDVSARNLFGAESFRIPLWPGGRDPWIADFPGAFSPGGGEPPEAVFVGFGTYDGNDTFIPNDFGLPVAYDPLWWAQVRATDPTIHPLSRADVEGRFGSGLIQFPVRPDPDGKDASAHGLQRVTTSEFLYPDPSVNIAAYQALKAAQVFASLDDPVLQTEGTLSTEDSTIGSVAVRTSVGGSPVLPVVERRTDGTQVTFNTWNDWSFTWMFTGRRVGLKDPVYRGDIVIMHNRQLSLTPIADASGAITGYQPSDERVVEAVWGYGTALTGTGTLGYSPRERVVLLRWPANQPDPDVRVGSWIADVTYERYVGRSQSRFYGQEYGGQRCHWYRVAKRTDPMPGGAFSTDLGSYREMTVTTEGKVDAKTLLALDATTNRVEPVHVNVALINPSVVYVFRNIDVKAR